jgi:hypothetical protein
MTASEKPQLSGWDGRRAEPLLPAADPSNGSTVRQPPPLQEAEEDGEGEDDDGSSILGFPAELDEPAIDVPPPATGAVVPVPPARFLGALVFHRRVEGVGGVLLVLAGIAGGVSLALPWLRGDGTTGSGLVGRAIAVLGAGPGDLLHGTLWQPFAVVFGGYALLLLGLLLFVPARTHRFLGVLAFLVAVPAAGGVLVPLADAHWGPAPFDVGMWFAVAVPVLGLLGALKAMLTGPRVAVRAPGARDAGRHG